MEIFKLIKANSPTQFFKETLIGFEIGTDPLNLVSVTMKHAQIKWESLTNNGYKRG